MTTTTPITLTPRTAIVTGAASGIGAATVLELARQGYRTVGIDSNADGAHATAIEATKINALTHTSFRADVADEAQVIKAFDHALSFLTHLDVLVTSAGVADTTPFMDLSVATFRAVHDINVIGTFLCIREAAKRMQRGGRICTLASVAGLRGGGLSGTAAYAASKGGLLQFTRWLSTVLAPDIRVNAITPGGLWREQPEEFHERYRARTPLQRMGSEEDLKGAAAYLASDLSAYMTGQNLVLDGGFTVW